MSNFFDNDEWGMIFNHFDISNADLNNYGYSIYENLLSQKKKQAEELNIQERLSTLMAMINFTLDCGNKEEFMAYSKQYNELKLQLI